MRQGKHLCEISSCDHEHVNTLRTLDHESTTALFPPDWSTMIPDILVAVITGVAVGAALLIADRLSAADAERRRFEKLGTRLVHPLLLVLQRPEYFPRFEGIGQLGKKQREALKILEHPDLDDWHETNPTELTRSLVQYRNALRDQRHDREDLAQTLADWARIHGQESRIEEYAEARLLEAHSQALLERFSDGAERGKLEREFEVLRTHGHVKSHARAFRAALGRSKRSQGIAHDQLVARMKALAKPKA